MLSLDVGKLKVDEAQVGSVGYAVEMNEHSVALGPTPETAIIVPRKEWLEAAGTIHVAIARANGDMAFAVCISSNAAFRTISPTVFEPNFSVSKPSRGATGGCSTTNRLECCP